MATSNDFQWATVIADLERLFRERGMRTHLEQLLKFKAGYEKQQRRLYAMPRPPWTTESLVELAACFQLPPFADYYPVLPGDNRCPTCRADLSAREVATVQAVFSDRALHGCRHCGGRWLVLKAPQ